MQLRPPSARALWAIGILVFVAVFAWFTAPNPAPISNSDDPFVGRWLVNGVDAFGSEYSGSLTIRDADDGYLLEWIITGALVSGSGELEGGVLVAEWKSLAPGREAQGRAEYRLEGDQLIGVVSPDGVADKGRETGERLPG